MLSIAAAAPHHKPPPPLPKWKQRPPPIPGVYPLEQPPSTLPAPPALEPGQDSSDAEATDVQSTGLPSPSLPPSVVPSPPVPHHLRGAAPSPKPKPKAKQPRPLPKWKQRPPPIPPAVTDTLMPPSFGSGQRQPPLPPPPSTPPPEDVMDIWIMAGECSSHRVCTQRLYVILPSIRQSLYSYTCSAHHPASVAIVCARVSAALCATCVMHTCVSYRAHLAYRWVEHVG